MGMMRQSPSPRPVPLLVDILEGMNGQANIAVRLSGPDDTGGHDLRVIRASLVRRP